MVAYAGLIIFLMGLGWLVAWALQKAGMQPVLAGFLGLAIIGLLVAGIGTILLLKAVKAFSSDSLAPQRTLQTIQRLKGDEQTRAVEEPAKPRPSSEEMQIRVEETEDRIGVALDELGRRLSPKHINAQVKHKIQENPYRAGMLAMAAGVLSGLLLSREFRRP
jgi:ElaB/YqjD/DUF883 family membrane-anchored ribosome-binding protein